MLRSTESAEGLLARCKAARLDGVDFPTIWSDILRRHPLVLSHVPVQVRIESDPALQIQLMTGQFLRFQDGSFSLG